MSIEATMQRYLCNLIRIGRLPELFMAAVYNDQPD